MDEPGLPPGDRAARSIGSGNSPALPSLSAFSTPLHDRPLGSQRDAANLEFSSGLSFSPVPTSSLGNIGLALDASSSSSGSVGKQTADSSFTSTGSAVIPSQVPSMLGGTSMAVGGISSGVSSSLPPLGTNTRGLTPADAFTQASGGLPSAGPSMSGPPLVPAAEFSGSALPASSSRATQIPPAAVSVPQGHVPLIAVGGNSGNPGGGINPLPGMSSMPSMAPSAAISSVTPQSMASVSAYQVPHSLATPLPYGSNAPETVQADPGASNPLPGIPALPVGQVRAAPLHHWFYCKTGHPWTPFSRSDSARLETAFQGGSGSAEGTITDALIPTDGGRYDVDLSSRLRHAVYWTEEPSEVRRCTWFHKDEKTGLFSPYSEELSSRLEVGGMQLFCILCSMD